MDEVSEAAKQAAWSILSRLLPEQTLHREEILSQLKKQGFSPGQAFEALRVLSSDPRVVQRGEYFGFKG